MAQQQIPSVGRIVHYVMSDGRHLPAIITKVWQENATPQTACNLQIFGDASTMDSQPVFDRTSVSQGDGPSLWHWPEFVAPVETS